MLKRAILIVSLGCLFSLICVAQVPGVSTNMVSGTQWPGGDPFLQRQNEPSMAVSSRNPLHVVAGDNDYRTVDLPFVQGADENGDAWLGLFTSNDGGATWSSTLVPGYPQDTSAQGTASPIHGFQAAADPGVRSGPNGMFLYGGLAFNRDQQRSAVFLARYTDDNNIEGGNGIRYLDTRIIAQGCGDCETFLDKPAIAVDMPRGNGTCTIPNADGTNQTIPAFAVYLAWTQFSLPESSNNGQIMFAQSQDCGVTWQFANSISSYIANTQGSYVQPFTNQGAQIAIDPNNGNVFVAWRVFANTSTGDADTVGVLFFPWGNDGFVHPEIPSTVLYQQIKAFDQGTTSASFRTNDYPAVAMDNHSNLYVAWAQREPDAYQDARIYLQTINMNYVPCTGCLESSVFLPQTLQFADNFSPYLIDNYGQYGHQIMPAMAFSAGKLTVAWYDFRDDDEELLYTSTNNPANEYTFSLQPDGSFAFGSQFAAQISDPSGAGLRHSVEVRAAQGVTSSSGVAFPYQPNTTSSVLVSQYAYGTPQPAAGSTPSPLIQQLEFDAPNLPLFEQGNAPFMGDYIDVAGPTFINDPVSGWRYNNLPTDPDYTHVVWADNRNVVPPADGNWGNYTPVNLSAGTISTFDPTQTITNSCAPGQTGMRNQDIYTTTLSPGLIMGALGNTKPLNTSFARQFAISIQNPTAQAASYRLSIGSQPVGGSASFVEAFPAGQPLTLLDITIPALSSASRPVFLMSSNASASIPVSAQQISAPGASTIISGGLSSSITLNPDATAPAIQNPNILNPNILNPNILNAEVYNPNILNPTIANPNILNPNILNPNILNPNISNITVANPNILNPNILNPNILNPNILNPNILNPNILNPNILNPNILNTSITDASYTVTNTGNTTSSYSLQLLQNQPAPSGVTLQVIVSGVYTTPVANGCSLTVEAHYVPLVNDTSPAPVNTPGALNTAALSNPAADSFTLAPGEQAIVTIRDYDSTTNNNAAALAHYDPLTALTPVLISAAPNTGSPSGSPAVSLTVSTAVLSNGNVGVAYSQTLQAFGGTAAGYTWTLPPGTSTAPNTLPGGLVLSSSGLITGSPTAPFSSTVQIQVTDSGHYTASKVFSLNIAQQQTQTVSLQAQSSAAYGSSFNVTTSSNAATTPSIQATGPCTFVSSNGNTFTYKMTAGSGTCSLVASWAATANYLSATASLKVIAALATPAVSFTGAPASAAYGSTFIVTASTNAGIAATIAANSACSIKSASNAVTLKVSSGNCSLSATWLPTANYSGATLSQTTSAQRAPLTVTANNVSIIFAQTLPALTASYSGFVNGDAASVLTGSPSVTTTATSYTLPGTYAITAATATLSAANYTFIFVNGTLTVKATGTAPSSPTACNGAYTGTFAGSILVAPNQLCVIAGGVVNGGSLIVAADSNRINIGGAAGTTCTTNTIKGDIQVLSSSGAASISYNTIKGNLLLESDSGAVQVLNNKITNTLGCSGDKTISGSGNTAASKQGQCAKF
jgi:hypothetical protein